MEIKEIRDINTEQPYKITNQIKNAKNSDNNYATNNINNFMTATISSRDIIMDEDMDIDFMSNYTLEIDEINKIDNTYFEEQEAELEKERGISTKQYMQKDIVELEKKESKCPECGSTHLINDSKRGEVVCGACGLVIVDNPIDIGPEWRAFDQEQRDKRIRVGAPITYTIHDKGLSTMIDWRNKDIYGKDIPEKNRAQWYRLRKWQRKSRISGPGERNLALALNEMNRESSRLKLPKIIHESASVIYREVMEKDLIRGRSIEWVVAASLFVACRRGKVLRTLDEIADVSGIGKKEVGKTYRFIARELGIKVPFFTPMEYIPKYGSKLNLSGEVQAKAIAIIEEARKKWFNKR